MTTTAIANATITPVLCEEVTLRIWSGADLNVGLERWKQLESRLTTVPLAASSTWTGAWLSQYADLVNSRILTAQIGPQTVGACLVTEGVGQKSGPIPIRTLHIGTAGEPQGQSVCVEYNAVLAGESHRSTFVAAVREWQKSQSRFDEVRLDGWSADDLAGWGEATEMRLRESPFHDLAAARLEGVEPIERLGRSTRQNLRRILRKYGELQTTWAQSLEDADEILNELIQLHQARWTAQGQPGAFASPRFERFQRELLVRGFGEGKVVAFRVRHERATVGCLFLLVDRGRLLDYLSGFAPFEDKPSPGLVSHFLCLTEAAKRGYEAYDFLVGEKRHKANLSTNANQLAWAVWRRPTLRNRAVQVLKTTKRLLKSRKPVSSSEEAAGGTAVSETTAGSH